LGPFSACEDRFVCELGPRSNELIVADHILENINDFIVDMTVLADGSYVFAGFTYSGDILKPWMRKLGTDGLVSELGLDRESSYQSVHGLESGNLLAASVDYLQELDGNLGEVWTSPLEGFAHYAVTGETGFALVQDDGEGGLVLKRFDSSGSFMWENRNIGQDRHSLDYPVLLQDGSIVVLYNNSFDKTQSVYAFDFDGNEFWSKSFEINDCRNCRVIASAPIPGDGFAVAWRDGYELTNVEFVGKVGLQGDMEWTRKLPYHGIVRKVAGLQDGSVVLAGTTCKPDDRDRDIWIYILDSGGKKIADFLFGGDGEEYSSAVLVDDRGCIAIASYESRMINGQRKSPGKVIWIPQPGKDCSVAWEE
jgi:hypothetical protein